MDRAVEMDATELVGSDIEVDPVDPARVAEAPMGGSFDLRRGRHGLGHRRTAQRLPAEMGLSATSLHRHFKAVTGYSPLAYQRYLRLLDARRRLPFGSASVTATAHGVEYASASQFSLGYKRMFEEPPGLDVPPPTTLSASSRVVLPEGPGVR